MFFYLIRKIGLGQGNHEYKRKLFEFINLGIDNMQLFEVTNKRPEERGKGKRKKKEKNVNAGVNS